MGSRMVEPLRNLIAGAERAAYNEFTVPVPESGWGELNTLTRSFNTMMQTLGAYQEMQVDRLLEEKAKLEALVHTIPDGIVLASFDGKIIYMNLAARTLLTNDAGAIGEPQQGSTIHDTFREPVLRESLLSLLHGKTVSASNEIELHDLAGKRLGVFECRCVTVLHNQREIGIVVTMRDVTAERDLVHLREEFYYGIAHDLRGPLTGIDGFTEIMMSRWSELTSEQVNTYMGCVRRSSERIRHLVEDILDAAKIESGTLELKLEPLPAADLVARIKSLFVLQGEGAGISLAFDTGGAPSRLLLCDSNLIERVLMNLMGNALKFTPKGGRVTLRVQAAGTEGVEFSVQDTGSGIPKDKLEFVFEKFKQLEGSGKSAGYGLGLSICKKIVELHKGRIWCESEPGQGSRFVFRLPFQPGDGALMH
jgi:signal transduction histidine kinase